MNQIDPKDLQYATAVLFTPRADNPTGASWSADRRMTIADVLAAHPQVIAIEDDQFAGVASTRSGSLLLDRRVEDRVVYIRSFSTDRRKLPNPQGGQKGHSKWFRHLVS